MTRVRYLGLRDPEREFEALRPAYKAAIKMMARCKPFGPDYLALMRITDAMSDAAQHFMPKPGVSFFGSRPTGGGQPPAPLDENGQGS